jgi:glycosyltransferase involved in cell wall biosynthesis
MATTEANREWIIQKDDLKFPYEIMFEGVLDNIKTSDLIIKTWRKLDSIKPDILVLDGYSYAACWAGFFWAKKNARKIIIWSSSNEDDKKRFFLKEKLKSFLVKRCDAANVYGRRSKTYLVKLGMPEDRIFIMGNTTNNSFYYDQTMKFKKDGDLLRKKFGLCPHNFLYIGRFSPEKNVIYLLNAYRKLKIEGHNWGMLLVGNGPQEEGIEGYINRYDIKDVYMPGFKQKGEIPRYLAVSDVFILASVYEPWGLVVNEAMAAGLPVLVSKKCGCYPDLIKDGVNGFSFDPFDENELLHYMKIVSEGKCDLTAMGRESLGIIKSYTPERAAKIVMETIKLV